MRSVCLRVRCCAYVPEPASSFFVFVCFWSCISHSVAQGGVGSFLETDNLSASLGGGKPNEQRELLTWLTGRVPQDPTHAGAKALLKPVFTCVEDRNADVRKAAQELVAVLARR